MYDSSLNYTDGLAVMFDNIVPELQIRRAIEDNLKTVFLISQCKPMF